MFADRAEAGRRLARKLLDLDLENPIVIALPRGGVPVGAEIARALQAPLDVLLVRKIGAPNQPELAIGAVAEGVEPQVLLSEGLVAALGIPACYIEQQRTAKLAEIDRQREVFRAGRGPVDVAGRTVIAVDDGLATGTTMRAALRSLRAAGALSLILAVPVAPTDTLVALQPEADRIVCLDTPRPFFAIGGHYRDFHQVPDREVMAALARLSPQARSGEAEPTSEGAGWAQRG